MKKDKVLCYILGHNIYASIQEKERYCLRCGKDFMTEEDYFVLDNFDFGSKGEVYEKPREK